MADKNVNRGDTALGRFGTSVLVLVAAEAVLGLAHGAGSYVGEKYKAWRKSRDERIRREARQGKGKKRKPKSKTSGRSASEKAKRKAKKKAA